MSKLEKEYQYDLKRLASSLAYYAKISKQMPLRQRIKYIAKELYGVTLDHSISKEIIRRNVGEVLEEIDQTCFDSRCNIYSKIDELRRRFGIEK